MDISGSLKKKAEESEMLRASVPNVKEQSELQEAIAIESAEHPTLPPEVIEVIAKDHLAKDPEYYEKEEDEEDEGEEAE